MSLATRHAARLAAGAMLSCMLASAHAHQPGAAAGQCDPRRQPLSQDSACPAPRKPDLRDPSAKRECARLRTAIQESEQAERGPRAAMMESVQQDLAILRQRYKKLGCL